MSSIAAGIFCRIRDQLVDDKPKRDGKQRGYFNLRALNQDGVAGSRAHQQIGEIFAEALEILLELYLLLMIEQM